MAPWKGSNWSSLGEFGQDLEYRTKTKDTEVTELGEENESHGLQLCMLLMQSLEMQQEELREVTTGEEFLDI